MAGSEKEKHYANSRARRHSRQLVVVSQNKKSKRSKKDKDGDSDSGSSDSSSDTVVVPPPEPRKCPLRFMLVGLFETDNVNEGRRLKGCPLRRVQLWHTIPLCLLAVINILLVIVALLGLAGYRIAMGLQTAIVALTKPESPYAESIAETDDGSLIAGST